MSDEFSVYASKGSNFNVFDSKENLFIGFNTKDNAWLWTTFDEFGEDIVYSLVNEKDIEDRVSKEGYREDFIDLIRDAMPNLWLIRMVEISDGSYGVDYSSGIKI